jgi:anti-sigma factor ChrR (cupin superfamily)
MRPDLQQWLPEYVLGTLAPTEMREMDALVAASPALRREVDLLTEALAGAAAGLVPVAPSPAVRARLLASVSTAAGPADRFAPFVAQLARLFDLPADGMRAVLARIDDAAAWLTFSPGIDYQHFVPGPRLAAVPGCEAGLVRLNAGVTFFRHRHLGGPETTFVLSGTMRDGEPCYGPGSLITREQGTVHAYAATADQDLLIAVLHHGIEPMD